MRIESSFIGPSAPRLDTWHRREAEAAAGTLDWWAAAFHWNKLKSLEPGNREIVERHEYAALCLAQGEAEGKSFEVKRRLVPPRDPRADVRLIDLTPHYTGVLGGDSFARWGEISLPSGVQKLGGVSFDVRGVIDLFGLEAAARGWHNPEQVIGIKVQQRCARIHLLHEAGWANALIEGEEMAAVVIHYANGKTQRIPIQSQVHIVEHWFSHPVKPTQADVVWLGTAPFVNSCSSTLRLVKYTWSNPHPDWEIAHVDLVSAKTKASYNLLALTVE